MRAALPPYSYSLPPYSYNFRPLGCCFIVNRPLYILPPIITCIPQSGKGSQFCRVAASSNKAKTDEKAEFIGNK